MIWKFKILWRLRQHRARLRQEYAAWLVARSNRDEPLTPADRVRLRVAAQFLEGKR